MQDKVLKATEENPTKNDFEQTCQKYLGTLEIHLTFDQISETSKLRLLKQKTKMAALKYLTKENLKQSKNFN